MTKRIDHQQVQIRFLDDGPQAVADMLDEGVSSYSLKKALKHLRDLNPSRAKELEQTLRRHEIITKRKGPFKPVRGDKRTYRVQYDKGRAWVRIPVEVLGVTRPGLVDVNFDDVITISKHNKEEDDD